MDEETLTPEWDFDMTEAIARASAAEVETPADEESDETPDDVDVGPDSEESGELTEDADPEVEELVDEEESSDAGDVGEEDQPAAAEVPEPTTQPVNPLEQEVESLRAKLTESVQTNQRILDILTQQRQAQQQVPVQVAKPLDLPDEVVQIAIFGGGQADWDRLPPDQQRAAKKLAADYLARETAYAKDPTIRHRELAPLIEQEVERRLAPILAERETARVREIFLKHTGDMQQADKARLSEIYHSIPLAKSSHMEDQLAAFELAVERVKVEKEKRDLESTKLRVAQRDQQQKAARSTRRGPNRKGSGTPPARNSPPPLGQFESPSEYAQRLIDEGFAL